MLSYNDFKDFAGPTATVVASGVAAYITWSLASRQQAIVRRQADAADRQAGIALDKLKADTFKQRYAIYNDISKLLKIVVREGCQEDFNPLCLMEFHVPLEEAKFFFSKRVCLWLDVLWKEDINLFLKARHDLMNPALLECQMRLIQRFDELAIVFRDDLALSQFTGDAPSSHRR